MQAISFRLSRAAVMTALAVAAAACGGSDTTTTPPKDTTPATITSNVTGAISGVAGTAVATQISVTVANKAGAPIDGATVTFAVATGGGSVSPTSVTTVAGIASTTWTLGPTLGTQTITATAAGLPALTITATATAGAAKNLVKASADSQSAGIGTNVAVAPAVKVTDANNIPVPGVLVTFTVATGGGLVSGGAVNTDSTGVARVTSWKLGNTVGTNTLSVTAAGITTPIIFTATGTVGAAASVTLSSTALGEVAQGDTRTLTAVVKDAGGNTITSPTITFASVNPAIATVSSSGVVTAVGPGNTTITATSGTAQASATITVIGHPVALVIGNTLQENSVLGDVAFTNNAMAVSQGSLLSVQIDDGTGSVPVNTVLVNRFGQFLLASPLTAGPILHVSAGTTTRVTYINPATAAVVDSVDVTDFVSKAVMSYSGAKAYFLLGDGELDILDVASKTQTRVQLGGGTNAMKLDHGDSLLYVNTNVGIMFEVDTRTGTVKRQITNVPASTTDFEISRDGKTFYLLDGSGSIVTLFDVVSATPTGSFGVSTAPTSIALTPDGKQIWTTHNGAGSSPARVTMYAQNANGSFISAGQVTTLSNPLHIYFSPSGSFAAVTNFGGWVDIIR